VYFIEYSTLDCSKETVSFNAYFGPSLQYGAYLCAVIGKKRLLAGTAILARPGDPATRRHRLASRASQQHRTMRLREQRHTFDCCPGASTARRSTVSASASAAAAAAPSNPSFMKFSSPKRLLGAPAGALGAADPSAGTQHGGSHSPSESAFARRHRGLRGGMTGRRKCVVPTKRGMMRMTMAAPPGKAGDAAPTTKPQ
jgi:hypothetical protein